MKVLSRVFGDHIASTVDLILIFNLLIYGSLFFDFVHVNLHNLFLLLVNHVVEFLELCIFFFVFLPLELVHDLLVFLLVILWFLLFLARLNSLKLICWILIILFVVDTIIQVSVIIDFILSIDISYLRTKFDNVFGLD